MEDLAHFVDRLCSDIETKTGCSVQKKQIKEGYHLSCDGVFAWARQVIQGQVVPDRCFPIQASKRKAIEAGVERLADRIDDNGWWDEPAVYWDVIEDDPISYNRAVEALGEICKSRPRI